MTHTHAVTHAPLSVVEVISGLHQCYSAAMMPRSVRLSVCLSVCWFVTSSQVTINNASD